MREEIFGSQKRTDKWCNRQPRKGKLFFSQECADIIEAGLKSAREKKLYNFYDALSIYLDILFTQKQKNKTIIRKKADF